MDSIQSNDNRENEGTNLEIGSQYDEAKRKLDLSNEFREIHQKIQHEKLKLVECRQRYGYVEKEFYNVSQLKDKGLFVLTDAKKRTEDLHNELKEIHSNYVGCISKTSHCEDLEKTVSEKVEDLTVKRSNLKKELERLRKTADENQQKLSEIKAMITIQEKKNFALIRKLKRRAESGAVPQDIKGRISAVLSDPRITKGNVIANNINY